MKLFFKYFVKVLAVEAILLIIYLLLTINIMPDRVRSIGHAISTLLSLPLSLINRSYPYWATGSIYFKLLLILVTLLTHTFIVYKLAKVFKK
ncbi:MAG: hypothetical protein BM557_00385 [Flavobacterium sp. MedPE-SWcel]|uniref:hypothetical protein n=1 Tax=uncultured Flavobacterium sp. TaxID=165435 RepID=UPI0009194A9A|nr:hypothetical protein [uncultured Flavobacterium sp.]OIQ22479.1 MAG: hypothetical protein BM557_00385 [Flavobacterium sp. MedPE-SWcel]